MSDAKTQDAKRDLKPGLGRLAAHEKMKKVAASPKYVVRSAAEILKMNPQPPVEVWGGITLTNDVFEIVGASGVGKSRIMLNLALTQVLADKGGSGTFAGLPTFVGPLKWLLLGTENGIYRLYTDLRRMTRYCNEEQMKVLDERLFLTTLEGDGDTYMAVDDEANVAKLEATIASVQPDIIVFDPWGDICGGSELDDKVVRETVAVLRRLRVGVKDFMPVVIVNHARMGELENLKATGLDAANFGKNSKALYTISRAVWNLNYPTADPTDGYVGLYNVKRSNGKPYPNRCIELDQEQMAYSFVPDFDFKANKALQIGKATTPKQNSQEARTAKFDNDVKKGVAAVKEAVKDAPIPKTTLDTVLKHVGVPVATIPNVVETLERQEGFKNLRLPGRNGKTMYGTAEQIDALAAQKAKEAAKKSSRASKKSSGTAKKS